MIKVMDILGYVAFLLAIATPFITIGIVAYESISK